jgi:hypothetical protein
MNYKIKNQMKYPSCPCFHEMPQEIQKICQFPSEWDSSSVVNYTKYFFKESQVENKQEGKFKNLQLNPSMFGL